ncbi:tRNA (mnm(5)s(2)U34)-methyltransferase [Ornithinibacillus bavariensis]|uniref:rRNA methylase YtqB n=1 Tax=Ornithinibacillus bavariensis TaxID=545502 RepID=A0A920C8D6_9BACI|nr:class I SAM-dependent methyltransferase [Ornithinibacillus bavariensis]GIO28588.1 putative rRNA methylase YtqB [Ornithinibacillus bavariensis]HAM79340.1 16S rRNA (cytosine(1402)-N(4))-methyltransferase [Ornithinibacillus sp.]
MKSILKYSHHLLEEIIQPGETVIDATCGNGNDTLFLSKLVGENGEVIAFDIQEKAINNTDQLLIENNCTNVSLVLDSHANMENYLSKDLAGKIGGAIFNLGYLPKSDKSIITKGESTIKAIQSVLPYLKPNGRIILVVYYGHDGGENEKNSILKYVISLDQKKFDVLRYGFINQKNNPPFIIAIQKK